MSSGEAMWWRISLSRGCEIACGRVGVRGGGAKFAAREFSPEGVLPVNENVPRGGEDFYKVEVSAREFSPLGALPVIKEVISSRGRAELWLLFFRAVIFKVSI